MDDELTDEELEEIEEKLLKEAEKKEQKPMPVSGKSVFDLKRHRDEKDEAEK